MESEKNVCPRCGRPGSGPHVKSTRNRPRGNEYHKYAYFAHRISEVDGSAKTKWCYLGVPLPKESDEELPNHGERVPRRLPNREPRSEGKRARPEKGCLRCGHLTKLDDRPFCRHLRGFLAPEMMSQVHDCFEKKTSEERG